MNSFVAGKDLFLSNFLCLSLLKFVTLQILGMLPVLKFFQVIKKKKAKKMNAIYFQVVSIHKVIFRVIEEIAVGTYSFYHF